MQHQISKPKDTKSFSKELIRYYQEYMKLAYGYVMSEQQANTELGRLADLFLIYAGAEQQVQEVENVIQ